MTPRHLRAGYALMIGAAFFVLAAWRHDLVSQAWSATCQVWAFGGAARARLLGEIFLFGGILAACWLTLLDDPRPGDDLRLLLIAAAAGWAAEAWGTRLGIWSYYTGEKPPLWIVPPWPLGALMIARLAARLRRSWPAPVAGAYAALSGAVILVCLGFCAPFLGRASGWLGPVTVALAVAAAARPNEDFWPLAVGLFCVFFADLWGTTNGCWAYYAHRQTLGLWRGILFGMSFDAAVVLASVKLSRFFNQRFA